MIRIINGKRYNTETADEVLALDNGGIYSSDFRFEETSLYRTPKGAWFVAGHGNAASSWRRRCGDMWAPGEGLNAICAQEAQDILEEHGQTELLEQYFPHKLEDA